MFTTKTLAEVHSAHAFYVIVTKINNGNSPHSDFWSLHHYIKIYLFYVVLKFVHHDFIFNLSFSHTNIVHQFISNVHLLHGLTDCYKWASGHPPPQAIHIISKIPLKNILDPRTHLFHCICDPYKGRIEKEFYLCVWGGGGHRRLRVSRWAGRRGLLG